MCAILLIATPARSQYKVRGIVYESTLHYPLEAVTVLSTNGKGTITNKYGEYVIEVGLQDSVWFSYLNKETRRFPVLSMINPLQFDISLEIDVKVLKEVVVKPRSYRFDSLQNRLDYARGFDFQRPKLKVVTPQYGGAVGFDLDEIINMFKFRHNRSMLSFQQRLISEEREKYVDHRFSIGVVKRLTGLKDSASLSEFMLLYKPSYEFTKVTPEYEFQKFIKDNYERYRKGLPPIRTEIPFKLED